MKKVIRAVLAGGMLCAAWQVPAASVASSCPGTTVDLQVHSTRRVPNDLMQTGLRAEGEDADPVRLVDAINRRMGDALRAARKYPRVRAETGNYQLYPVYDQGRIVNWRAGQELSLESRDFPAASRLIGALQGTLRMSGMRFSVSPEARHAAEARLIDDAIRRFRARAEQVRKSLQGHTVQIREMSIQSGEGQGGPVPLMRAMAAGAPASPALEPGESRIRIGVSGTLCVQ